MPTLIIWNQEEAGETLAVSKVGECKLTTRTKLDTQRQQQQQKTKRGREERRGDIYIVCMFVDTQIRFARQVAEQPSCQPAGGNWWLWYCMHWWRAT